VHAPASRGNPWDCPIPEDKNYILRPVAGVFHVYENEEKAEKGEHLNFPYYDLATFITDMNLLCAMIADGPL
jgi:AMP deaminase